MAQLFWAFRSLRCGFEMKLPPRARMGYSLLIVICSRNAVNGRGGAFCPPGPALPANCTVTENLPG